MNNLVTDLSDAVDGRIRFAFDLSRIAKEIVGKGLLIPIILVPYRISNVNDRLIVFYDE